MRRLLIPLAALVALCVPAAADAAPYKVSITGSIDESWQFDWQPQMGSPIRASGGAKVTFATPKPKRMAFVPDSGFRGPPMGEVTVNRNATVDADARTRERYYLEDTTGCGVRSYKTRIELNYGNKFHPQLNDDDSSLFDRVCPTADMVFAPKISDDYLDREYFSTARLLMLDGTSVKKMRLKIYSCLRLPCRHKRTNVIRFRKRYAAPYVDGGRTYGQYVATVEWKVKFVRIGKMPPVLR